MDNGSIYGPKADDADLAWMGSIDFPDDVMPLGFVSVYAWLDEEGKTQYKLYSCLDAGVTEHVGLLTRAAFDMQHRTERENEDNG